MKKLFIAFLLVVTFVGNVQAGVAPEDNQGGVSMSASEINRRIAESTTAMSGDKNITVEASSALGAGVYCMVRDTIQGYIGLSVALLVALYGLFTFLVSGQAKGFVVMLLGAAIPSLPSIFESFVTGMSVLSGTANGQVKSDNWITAALGQLPSGGGTNIDSICSNAANASLDEKEYANVSRDSARTELGAYTVGPEGMKVAIQGDDLASEEAMNRDATATIADGVNEQVGWDSNSSLGGF